MYKIEDTKVINIDDTPIAVDSLSDEIKSLIEMYDDFRRDETLAKHELIKVQAALRDIQREIITNINKKDNQGENIED